MDKKVPQQINDIVGDNVKKLAQLFPSAVKDGEVDFEALKEELGQFKEVGSEKYELTWAGKKNAKKIAQEDVVGRTLKFIPEESKNADTTENLYIEGDNLEVLKLLRQNYYGAVKMIYIDPPYNTGKDFVYNDSFHVKQAESDLAEGDADELGKRFSVNCKSQNRYHANWLNMMYPRLKIARDLLAEDGIICISIDDNEEVNIKKLCEDIFGAANCVGEVVRKTKSMTADKGNGFNMQHELLIIYAKNSNLIRLYGEEKRFDNYANPDNDPNGDWCAADPSAKSGSKSTIFPIVNPFTHKVDYPPEGRYWAFSQETLKNYIKIGRIKFKTEHKENERGFIFKRYKNNMAIVNEPVNSLFSVDNAYMNQTATIETKLLLDGDVFDYPKPVAFIQKLIKYFDADIILDFFSGSGTTANAIMKQNILDSEKRKFIMVQLPEICEKDTNAYRNGYKNICEIGKERIRRAGDKIKQEYPDADLDIGFKVFRTADTNIKWNSLMDMGQIDINQMENSPDTIDFMPNAKDVDIVYELMLRQKDVPLSSEIEQIFGGGYFRTYLYADSYLVCLETKITTELIDKLARIDPLPIKFIFRDSAFQDNIALKDETFRRLKALVEKNNGMKKMTYTVEFI